MHEFNTLIIAELKGSLFKIFVTILETNEK